MIVPSKVSIFALFYSNHGRGSSGKPVRHTWFKYTSSLFLFHTVISLLWYCVNIYLSGLNTWFFFFIFHVHCMLKCLLFREQTLILMSTRGEHVFFRSITLLKPSKVQNLVIFHFLLKTYHCVSQYKLF